MLKCNTHSPSSTSQLSVTRARSSASNAELKAELARLAASNAELKRELAEARETAKHTHPLSLVAALKASLDELGKVLRAEAEAAGEPQHAHKRRSKE